ncbi:MAG TPA: hypothetical protein VKA94_12375 [Hyphomicrobiales bacterium]|nr:hypothetical protein [Hyphomicrobiales bacterium]
MGNSTGVTLTRDILQHAGLTRGDDVAVVAENDRIIITKADTDRSVALASGRRIMQRYDRTLRALAK